MLNKQLIISKMLYYILEMLLSSNVAMFRKWSQSKQTRLISISKSLKQLLHLLNMYIKIISVLISIISICIMSYLFSNCHLTI